MNTHVRTMAAGSSSGTTLAVNLTLTPAGRKVSITHRTPFLLLFDRKQSLLSVLTVAERGHHVLLICLKIASLFIGFVIYSTHTAAFRLGFTSHTEYQIIVITVCQNVILPCVWPV